MGYATFKRNWRKWKMLILHVFKIFIRTIIINEFSGSGLEKLIESIPLFVVKKIQ